MGKNILLLLSVFVVAGSMAFLLITFFKRLKRIEKEMWEEKAALAKKASEARKAEVAQARKAAAEKKKNESVE